MLYSYLVNTISSFIFYRPLKVLLIHCRIAIVRVWLTYVGLQPRLGWTEAAMIAGAREAGVSPSIIGSFPRKEAALVEVYFQFFWDELLHLWTTHLAKLVWKLLFIHFISLTFVFHFFCCMNLMVIVF